MAHITYTEPKKRAKEKLDVYIDGVYSFTVCEETAAKFGLREGEDFTEEELEQIKEESDALWAFEVGLQSICRASTTRKLLSNKLAQKGFLANSVEKALLKLESYGYIDDRAYAKNYIESASKSKGCGKIKMELRNKGINSQIIDEFLRETDESDAAKAFFDKFVDKHDIVKASDRQKLVRAMQYRGFSWSSISQCLRGFNDDNDI